MKIQGDRVNDSALPDALSGPQRPRLQALLDFSPDVICSLDKEGHFIDVSAAAKTLWGYDPEELRGRHFIEFVLEEDRQRTLQAAEGVLQGVVSSDFENCFRCKDGSIRRNIWSASWNPRDEMVYCIARDGSERYKARQKAAQYEARLYEAYKLAGIGWWELNLPENELSVSDELYQIYGISRVQYPVFTTDVFLSLVHPDDLAHVQESLQAVQEVPYHQYDHRIVKPSGEVIYVIHYTHTVKDESGRVVKIHGTTKDISQRKGYEAALRRSQQKLEDIVESLGDGFYALDRAWTITYWNGRAERVTGKKREEVLGKNFWDVYPKAKMLRFYEEFDKALATNRPVHFEEFSPSLQAWMDVSAYPSQEGLSIYIKDITRRKLQEEERRQLDEKLQQSRQNLLHVLENMSDGFFTVNRQWTITFATEKVAAMLGVNKENYLGRNLWECFPQSVNSRFYTGYHQAFAGNTLVTFEEYLPGFHMWFEVNASPKGDELSVYLKDITERKRQERELQLSNERFHLVSQATSDVIWDWNVETGETYVNPSFTTAFGYPVPPLEVTGRLWFEKVHAEDRDRVVASQQKALRDPSVTLWEDRYRFVKACGEVAYVADRAVILRNEEGKAVRLIGAVQDITDRRRQEQRLEFMAKATSEVIWERALDSEVLEIGGDKFRQLFGYRVGDNRIPRSFWYEKVHPDDRVRTDENLDYALRYGFDSFVQEYRFQKADGTWAFVKDRAFVVRNEEGRAVTLMGSMEDVTMERFAEKALVESKDSYRRLFNNAPLPSYIFDKTTLRFIDVNSAATEHYGYSREEFLGMTLFDIRPPEDHQKLRDAVAGLHQPNRTRLGQITHLTREGKRILVEVSVTQIDYMGQQALLASISDVTEKVRLQEQLLKQKLNQQKTIAKAAIEAEENQRSEIGKELHDNVNQLLATAKLYVENIRYYPEQRDSFVDKGVSLLNRTINEIRRLSSALVTPTIKDVGFRETIMELVDSYKDLHLFEVVCSFCFEEAAIDKEVKLTIYRILQEQFNNTVKYAKASLVHVDIRTAAGLLQLSYQDDGVGFNPRTVKKGLGLNNIKSRTGAYKGKVQIQSAPGKGCRMNITIPITTNKPNT